VESQEILHVVHATLRATGPPTAVSSKGSPSVTAPLSLPVFASHVKITPSLRGLTLHDLNCQNFYNFQQQKYAATRFTTLLLALWGVWFTPIGSWSRCRPKKEDWQQKMDRNQRRPGRRRSQEDGDVWWAPRQGPDITAHTHSHTHHTIIVTIQLYVHHLLTGVARDFLGSLILKFPWEPAVYCTSWSRRRPKQEDWLKKKDRKQRRPGRRRRGEQASSCSGPCSPFWWRLSLVPWDCWLVFTRSKKTGGRSRWKVPGIASQH